MVAAESVGDDGGRHLQETLADRGPRAAPVGMPTGVRAAERWFGPNGRPARLPGNGQREAGFVPVFVLLRWAA